MCLPFSVALASKVTLAAGAVPSITVADYEAGLADRNLFELEERTTLTIDDEVESASNEHSTAARVSVHLRGGRDLSLLIQAPKGSPANPFTAEEHEARFAQEVTARVPRSVVDGIVSMSKNLDGLDARWLGRALSAAFE